MELAGTDKSTFTSDTAAQQAVIAAFAASLNSSSPDEVRIVYVTELARRRLYHKDNGSVHLRADVTTLTTGLTITLEFVYILEALGLTVADSGSLYAAMSAQSSAAVTSGAFAAALTTQLADYGSALALVVGPDTFSVGDFSVLVLATPRPSRSPTRSPAATISSSPTLITTELPTIAAASTSAGASTGLSGGAVAGVAVGALALLCIVLGAVYYMHSLRGRNSKGTFLHLYLHRKIHALSVYHAVVGLIIYSFLHNTTAKVYVANTEGMVDVADTQDVVAADNTQDVASA